MTPDEIAAVKAEHEGHRKHPRDGLCVTGEGYVDQPKCDAYRLAVEVERLAVALTSALTSLESSDCTFWACDGPEAELASMKSCSNCWAINDLRLALHHPLAQVV